MILLTHTPHARRDGVVGNISGDFTISTHTPHARCDGGRLSDSQRNFLFLLTHLMRGVTTGKTKVALDLIFLLTHLMRGVTRY